MQNTCSWGYTAACDDGNVGHEAVLHHDQKNGQEDHENEQKWQHNCNNVVRVVGDDVYFPLLDGDS